MMGMRIAFRTIMLAALGGTAMVPATAMAQAGGQSADAGTRDDTIIVTASKREERLIDVPFAITAIGRDDIAARGATDIKDLQFSIPGFYATQLTPGADRINLRGLNAGTGTGLPIVGVYVDEVGISVDQQQRDGAFPLFDIARVEVLRGPQGTIYGQGSLAGTIRYITVDPSLTAIDGTFEGNVYSQENGGIGFRANGAASLPILTDKVGVRLVGGYERQAGWIDYPNAKDANEINRWYFRPKLLVKPTDDLTISLLYQYYKQEGDTDNIASFTNPLIRNRSVGAPNSDRVHLVNGIISYDFGPVALTSSTGYQDRRLEFNGFFGPFVGEFITDYKQFTQEVRLSSSGEGPLNWTVGGWYRDFDSHVERTFFLGGVATPVARRSGDDPVDSKSWAIFADGTWSLTDRFDVSLGGRYYSDKRTTGSSIPAVATREAKFDAFSPKATMRYAWNDDMSTYATVSKGFRSGGFNGSGSTFDPETLWNYEIGTKASLLDGALFIDLAGYYLDYKDRQAQTIVEIAPGVFVTETRNAGAASGLGLEGAFTFRPGAGFLLEGAIGWNDIRADVTNAEVVKGERFSLVPGFTGSFSVSQKSPINQTTSIVWRADYQHAAAYSSIFRGTAGSPPVVIVLEDFRSTPQDYLNIRIGLEKPTWSLMADVTNLLDEQAALFPNSPIAASNEAAHARPRSFGLTFRWNYGQ